MNIVITADGTATMTEATDLKSLRVTGTEPSSAPARARLAEAGINVTVDGAHAFIEPATFVGLAGELASDGSWRADLDQMLAYAKDHGWTDDAGRIRAHTEWDDRASD